MVPAFDHILFLLGLKVKKKKKSVRWQTKTYTKQAMGCVTTSGQNLALGSTCWKLPPLKHFKSICISERPIVICEHATCFYVHTYVHTCTILLLCAQTASASILLFCASVHNEKVTLEVPCFTSGCDSFIGWKQSCLFILCFPCFQCELSSFDILRVTSFSC